MDTIAATERWEDAQCALLQYTEQTEPHVDPEKAAELVQEVRSAWNARNRAIAKIADTAA